MSSIKSHPSYPFVLVGRAHDFYPSLSSAPQGTSMYHNSWIMVLGESEEWGCLYDSEQQALADVEAVLFNEWHTDLVEAQLALAKARGHWDLALRLTEKRAFITGYKKANEDLMEHVKELKTSLFMLAHTIECRR